MIALLFLSLFLAGTDFEKWLEEDVKYIISSRERQEFKALEADPDRERFIEEFWKRRDPEPATVLNEFEEEHYARIRYANDRFDNEGKPGWKTTRGQAYIIHGPPDDRRYSYGYQTRVSVSNPTEILNPQGQRIPFIRIEFPAPESETWVYRSLSGASSSRTFFTIVFAKMEPLQLHLLRRFISRVSFSASIGGQDTGPGYQRRRQRDLMIKEFITKQDYFRNDYRIVYAGGPRYYDLEDILEDLFNPRAGSEFDQFSINEATADLYRSPGDLLERLWERRRKMEELVNSQIFFGTLDLNVVYGFLRDPEDFVRLHFQAEISLPEEGELPEEVDLAAELVDLETNRTMAGLQDALGRSGGDASGRLVYYESRLSAPPGSYRLRLMVSDLKNQRIGLWEKEVQVPRLRVAEFDTSELLVCENVLSAKDLKGRRKKGQGKWVSRFGKETPLAFDEHVFIPSPDMRFRRGQQLTTLLEVYNPTIVAKKPDVSVSAIFQRDGESLFVSQPKKLDYLTGKSESIIYAFSLPLGRLDIGRYDLLVRVTDKPSGRSIVKNASVEIF